MGDRLTWRDDDERDFWTGCYAAALHDIECTFEQAANAADAAVRAYRERLPQPARRAIGRPEDFAGPSLILPNEGLSIQVSSAWEVHAQLEPDLGPIESVTIVRAGERLPASDDARLDFGDDDSLALALSTLRVLAGRTPTVTWRCGTFDAHSAVDTVLGALRAQGPTEGASGAGKRWWADDGENFFEVDDEAAARVAAADAVTDALCHAVGDNEWPEHVERVAWGYAVAVGEAEQVQDEDGNSEWFVSERPPTGGASPGPCDLGHKVCSDGKRRHHTKTLGGIQVWDVCPEPSVPDAPGWPMTPRGAAGLEALGDAIADMRGAPASDAAKELNASEHKRLMDSLFEARAKLTALIGAVEATLGRIRVDMVKDELWARIVDTVQGQLEAALDTAKGDGG